MGTVAVASVLLTGRTDAAAAIDSVRPLFRVIAFLVSVLVVSMVCAREGLFSAIGARISRAGRGSATRLLGLSFLAAAVVTSVLNLDATVVLLTPVLIAAAGRTGTSRRPAAWSAIRLANSASTLFPVSNLTNLLAFTATGLTFLRFTWLMAPVWVVALVLEWTVTRTVHRTELGEPASADTSHSPPIPRFALTTVLLMLVAFAAGSPLGIDPAWSAALAAVVLVSRSLRTHRVSVPDVVRSAGLPLAYLVLCWGVVVEVVARSRVSAWVGDLLSASHGLGPVVLVAVLSMLLANVVNNLPAALLLVPLVAPLGPVLLLAMLIGLDVGANLTYLGSLANLLWLGVAGRDRPSAGRFHLTAVLTTPVIVVACATTLWSWSSLVGA